MGFFSKKKKSAPTTAPTANKPGTLERFTLKRHETRLLKHATKDQNGYPMASRIYWNVSVAMLAATCGSLMCWTRAWVGYYKTPIPLYYELHTCVELSDLTILPDKSAHTLS
jgi:hypothetical protein